MVKLACWKSAFTILFIAAVGTAAPAQVFTSLVSFDGTNGAAPDVMSLIQGTDGILYGTTMEGGNVDGGTLFRVTPGGNLTLFYNLPAAPEAGLLLARDGNFYGTTIGGYGSVFKITPTGSFTTLYTFYNNANTSYFPNALIQSADGNFYGTTRQGGAYQGGTIFKMTALGVLTTIYNFCAQNDCADGFRPMSGLVLGTDGNFYGTTSAGGTYGDGTVFKITAAGVLTTLHIFDSADGQAPFAALTEATNGSFYGTTSLGGDLTCNAPYGGCGTVFQITPQGAFTTLHMFHGTDGSNPYAGLAQGTDGNLYGTTTLGGANYGTVFRVTGKGAVTTLHTFELTDGANPYGGLLQATNGKFYGTTYMGGSFPCQLLDGCGTVYNLNVGLGPFVSFVGNPAKVGQRFGILGQGLTGTTSVSMNGVPVNFTVRSNTLIVATVPAGVTTGYVKLTGPSGTLTSNVPFRVIP